MDSWLQGGALFLLTFLSEDAAVAGAVALAAAGSLSYPLAFVSCSLGIWLGDLWLYGMARAFGADYIARLRAMASVERSREWFESRGVWVLLLTRMVPGSRLPTYLAAGLIGYPARRFAVVTGAAALVWVAFFLAGGRWLWSQGKWPALLVVVTFFVIWYLSRKHWEFWPSWIFYLPVALFYLWLALRYRGFTLPTAANPAILMGGLVGESKFDTLERLLRVCPEHTTPTWCIRAGQDRFRELEAIMEAEDLSYPVILKPDVGQRGAGVKFIGSPEGARDYLKEVPSTVLLQKYAQGPMEAGVFYYRMPGEQRGHIFAITEKIFPRVIGDGLSSIEQLILADPRAATIAATYLRRFDSERSRVLVLGEELPLVQAGNHAQGCIFRDGRDLGSDELLKALDRISHGLDGFYIGRFDIRYASEEDLKAGRGLQIVELNGAGAEATSIYDARNSIFRAYFTLFRQWSLVFRIGAANRARGEKASPIGKLIGEWRKTNALLATYPLAD